jgi:hypothetical protein
MNLTRLALVSVSCAALLVTTPAVARAQESSTSRDSAPSCLMSIPDSALRRVVVYVQAVLIDSTDKAILPGLDLLAQQVADSVRTSLGVAADQLPNGEPAVTWRALESSLLVVVRRDGRITSTLPTSKVSSSVDSYRADTAATHLLARALASVAEDDGYFTVWPDGFEPDSVAFHLVINYPFVDGRGVITPIQVRQAFPLFSVGVPPREPVVVKRRSIPRYPKDLPAKGVTGDLIIQFIVDTTGHADMTTVKDLWPSSRPRLTGEMGEYYDAFRQAVVRSLPKTLFEPARLGGCKVKQLVQLPFGFKLAR